MKKLIVLLGWAAGAVGLILLLLGIIARIAGGILWNHMWSNYYNFGGSFFVLGIFLFLGSIVMDRDKQ